MTTPTCGIHGRDPLDELLALWNAWLWLFYSIEPIEEATR